MKVFFDIQQNTSEKELHLFQYFNEYRYFKFNKKEIEIENITFFENKDGTFLGSLTLSQEINFNENILNLLVHSEIIKEVALIQK